MQKFKFTKSQLKELIKKESSTSKLKERMERVVYRVQVAGTLKNFSHLPDFLSVIRKRLDSKALLSPSSFFLLINTTREKIEYTFGESNAENQWFLVDLENNLYIWIYPELSVNDIPDKWHVWSNNPLLAKEILVKFTG